MQMELKYHQINSLVKPKLHLHNLKIPSPKLDYLVGKNSWRESIGLSSQIKDTDRSEMTVYDTPLLPKLDN